MTDKLNLNLTNCYGIGSLEVELEFKHKGYAIYAPNGVMKTSFAKTMMDISNGEEPKDIHFPNRASVYDIKLNDEEIKAEDIFVVRSYDDKFTSDKVSTLLANSELRKKYEDIHKSIGDAKKTLDKTLKSLAGFGEKSRENLDPIIEGIFDASYYDALVDLEDELNETEASDLSNVNFKILFDSKVQQFLDNKDVAEAVEDFAQKYDEITEKSPILRRNFQYHNVMQVQQQLQVNNFFRAGHRIRFADDKSDALEEFSSDQSLKDKIEEEKTRILENKEVAKRFDSFNSKLKNKELQTFRDYITDNKHILPYLKNPEDLKRELWIQFLLRAKAEYKALVDEYRAGQEALAEVISAAESGRADWDEVVTDFNRRFLYLPFELVIENKADAILKDISPSIGFVVKNSGEERRYKASEKHDLLRALSTGEGRALYILDIMYEVFVRWKHRKKTLFIFDDISDSFDYKNKFAIVDFLEEVTKSDDNEFIAIILTHNFDFLRTLSSRQICPSHQCKLAFRSEQQIKLESFKQSDIQSPFHKWQSRLDEPVILIAYIPFLRNVIEYTSGARDSEGDDNEDYIKLTWMLHYKDETKTIKMEEYKKIFEKYLPNCAFPNIDTNSQVMNCILNSADECEHVEDGVNLEHKIVLSMAVRMLAERYMIEKIRSIDPEIDISRKQTGELFRLFKEQFNNQHQEIGLLRRVNLITPANIHINAFMYEPILDMGIGELWSLYIEVKETLVQP